MECLHGKAASYNLLEGIYANAVAQEVERLCVESCNGCQVGHLSQGQHDCLVMNENERWQMYGLQAIERVNAKRMVWSEFAEAMRVLKLRVDRDVLEHLQQLEKGPDSTFGDSLMELQQNTENHELQCMLNYLFHWRLEDPLELVAETFSSYPPTIIDNFIGTINVLLRQTPHAPQINVVAGDNTNFNVISPQLRQH